MSLMQRLHPYVHFICRVLLAWIFIQSGWEKLLHLQDFYQDALNYKILTEQFTYFYAVCLPWMEILAGAYLLLGLFVRFAASLSGAMMLSFIIAVSMVLVRGDAIDCGCYVNGKSSPIDTALLLRDIGLFIACAYLIWKPKAPVTVDRCLEEPMAAV